MSKTLSRFHSGHLAKPAPDYFVYFKTAYVFKCHICGQYLKENIMAVTSIYSKDIKQGLKFYYIIPHDHYACLEIFKLTPWLY